MKKMKNVTECESYDDLLVKMKEHRQKTNDLAPVKLSAVERVLVLELLQMYIHKQFTSENPILCPRCTSKGMLIRMVTNAPLTQGEEDEIGFLNPDEVIQWSCPVEDCHDHCHYDLGKNHVYRKLDY